ncbi:MAG: small ribosomal subunit Rsm22 family protein, partial [Desulfovibrio sp.]|nr:small ribosomal subunit Rsm22 family protein [Desulfovibrio sp.]
LYYFLPWNVIRLCRLLNGLNLPAPDFAFSPLLMDVGSGPLTFPLALWMAKPAWRDKPLKIWALDSAKRPMELGLKIFDELCSALGVSPWRIILTSAPAFRAAMEYGKRAAKMDASPWLLSAVNVLNETRQFTRGADEDDPENDDLYRMLGAWSEYRLYRSFAGILVIEPGTRLGGETIATLRDYGTRDGFYASAPCVAGYPCPFNREKRAAKRWCHFTFAASDAPAWLRRLSVEAGLEKKSLSLSFALLETKIPAPRGESVCRVISQPFAVPGLSDSCRYACSASGLALLPDAKKLPSGSIAHCRPPANPRRDKQSGAIILESAGETGERPGNTRGHGFKERKKSKR